VYFSTTQYFHADCEFDVINEIVAENTVRVLVVRVSGKWWRYRDFGWL